MKPTACAAVLQIHYCYNQAHSQYPAPGRNRSLLPHRTLFSAANRPEVTSPENDGEQFDDARE